MKKRFVYEYEDLSEEGAMECEYSEETEEKLVVNLSGETVFITGNSEGLLALAKMLIMMAEGKYDDGFHIHVNEDFDGDKRENLVITVNNKSWE